MNRLHRGFRNAVFKLRRIAGIERTLLLAGQAAAQANRARMQVATLADVEFGVYSQWGEDGILDWLVERLGLADGAFLEFGVEDYRESNTRFLLTNRNWRGLVIDGDPGNVAAILSDDIAYKHDLDAVAAFVTAETIEALTASLPPRLGLLSVDIDGVDYWILAAITRAADIVVVEYNDFLGEQPVSVPYRVDFVRGQAHWSNTYWGASLAAFRHLLEGRGYVFAGTNRVGTNAFFVHADHAAALRAAVGEAKAWPCRMRETRQRDGSLALKRYGDFRAEVAELPLVRVDTGETVRLGEVARRD